jgi:hypothetical protein
MQSGAFPYWLDALIPADAAGGAFSAYLSEGSTLYFCFPVAPPGYLRGTNLDGWKPFSVGQQAHARSFLASLSALIDVRFVETTNPQTLGVISFQNNKQSDTGGYAYYPWSSPLGSDVFINSRAASVPLITGTAWAATIVHEIGHALGLKHPFEKNDANSNASEGPYLPPKEDITTYTVMSYTEDPFSPGYWFAALDIAALQYLYGPSKSGLAGDTRFYLSTLTSNFVWDGGGTDTLEASLLTQPVNVSLTPGDWGFIGSARAQYITDPGQITINFQSQIENVNGTPFADTILGNELGNELRGGAGNDRLAGRAGDDLIVGGSGTDSAAWAQSALSYALRFLGGVWQVIARDTDEGTDTLKEMEVLEFADRRVLIEREESPSYADLPADLYQFFIVAFNAAPGVTYMNQLAEAYRYWMLPGGRSSEEVVQQVVDVFITKSQFTDVYGLGLENTAFARLLVKNIVKSSASEEAKEQAVRDIVDALGVSGWGRGKVIYTVFGNLADKPFEDGVWGGTARLFANEIAVAKAYTEVMDQSTTDLATLRSVLEATGAESEVLTQEQAVALAVKGLMGQGGLVSGWQEPTSLWDPWTIDPIFGPGGI